MELTAQRPLRSRPPPRDVTARLHPRDSIPSSPETRASLGGVVVSATPWWLLVAAAVPLLAFGCSEAGEIGGLGGAAPTSSSSGGGGASSSTTASGGQDLKDVSQSCASGDQCHSSYCPADDLVCCATVCDGKCEACLQSKTGLPNGQCGPVLADLDPDLECTEPGSCDGAGQCCGEHPEPPGGLCPPECTGGCIDSTCHVDCTGVENCRDYDIVCPSGFACHVDCTNNLNACRQTMIVCPSVYACQVDCAGDSNECQRAIIQCGTGACELYCDGSDGCQDTELLCGSGECRAVCGDESEREPDVQCGEACRCVPCDPS